SLMSLFMLAVACLLYFVPGVFEGQSRWLVIAVKVGWFGITAVCVLAPLQAFREFVVVSDEGLVKYSLFGSRSSLGWKEISGLRSKRGDNEITFEGSGRKLKMSLCYDGWEDFRELARKHLPGGMNLALAGVLDTGKPRPQENPAHPPGVK
ncbi:MAG TPA: hypothetical protein VN578_24585, partial [Candidatus Binatia bacterium]|nr:hypothetical protein [Candidatus Binatia bacterium]